MILEKRMPPGWVTSAYSSISETGRFVVLQRSVDVPDIFLDVFVLVPLAAF